jgi:putative RNA 2'-phosphotransferase
MDYERLSRTMAHALRHEPWVYELEVDEEGWAPLDQLLVALRTKRREWRDLDRSDLREMMRRADKRRYEIRGDRIRALYGHSLPGTLSREEARPPERLFHGTSPGALPGIRDEGLRPMGRQHVHLSTDRPTAREVGRRKARDPAILLVRAREAHRDGVSFYRGNEKVWLSDPVPPAFVAVEGGGG